MEEMRGGWARGGGFIWGSESILTCVPCRRLHQQICIVGRLDESPAGRAVGLVRAVHRQHCAVDLAPADEAGQVLL